MTLIHFSGCSYELGYCEPSAPVWDYEGIAFEVNANEASGTEPVYRFYSSAYNGHFYTLDIAEKDYIEDTYDDYTWKYEGIGFYANTAESSELHSVHRFWSDLYQRHFYTISDIEKDYVIETYPENVWRYEGVAFFAHEFDYEATEQFLVELEAALQNIATEIESVYSDENIEQIESID